MLATTTPDVRTVEFSLISLRIGNIYPLSVTRPHLRKEPRYILVARVSKNDEWEAAKRRHCTLPLEVRDAASIRHCVALDEVGDDQDDQVGDRNQGNDAGVFEGVEPPKEA